MLFDHSDLHISGLVVDLSEFEYEWGGDINVDPPSCGIPYLVYLNQNKKEK